MTDSQIKYQALMEDQRHNLVMEKFSKQEQESKALQARASWQQSQAAMMNTESEKKKAEASLLSAQAAQANANIRNKEWGVSLASLITSFIIPDANTVLRSGAQVMSSLFS